MDFLRRLVKSLSTTFSSVSGYIYSLLNSQTSDNKSRVMKNKTVEAPQKPVVQKTEKPATVKATLKTTKAIITPIKEIIPKPDFEEQAILATANIDTAFKKSLLRTLIRGGVDVQEASELILKVGNGFEDKEEYLLKYLRDPKEFFYSFNEETGMYEFNYDPVEKAKKIKQAIKDYLLDLQSSPENVQKRAEEREVRRMQNMLRKAARERKRAEELEKKIEEANEKKRQQELQDAIKRDNERKEIQAKENDEPVEVLNVGELMGTSDLDSLFFKE